MKNKLSNSKRKILIRNICFALGILLLYIAAGMGIVFMAWSIYSLYNFQGWEPIYKFAHFFEDYMWLFAVLYFCVGFFCVAYHFFSRPYIQIEKIVQAARKLYEEEEVPEQLHQEIADVALEFTEIKVKMLENEKMAREAEQRKNDLVMYLAHDLKTPLTSVIGYLSLLRDEKNISEELRKHYLDISMEKAERLEDLINEFFEITRFNLTTLTLEKSTIDFTRMLEQLVFEFKPMVREKNLTVNFQCEADLQYSCDVDKMQRALDNLLRNAVNYSYDNGCIQIVVHRRENQLEITFENQGKTIQKEKINRIFEQFYRLDTARTSSSGGAGLGLAITKEIVELHGGTIRAESFDEKIYFHILLPYSEKL